MELGQVMRTFGWLPSEGELQELIGEVDQDGNGCITFNEFVWLMTRWLYDCESSQAATITTTHLGRSTMEILRKK